MEPDKLQAVIESLIFASETPINLDRLKQGLDNQVSKEHIRQAIEQIREHYRVEQRGIKLEEVAGGYQFRTKMENAFWVKRLYRARSAKLSQAAMEALAIVAYRQPVTRADIEQIRGVDCGGVLRVLLDRSLIRIAGKKDEPGRPLIYGTTRGFLSHFSLQSLKDLPSLKDLKDLSNDNPPEEPQEELPLPQ